MVMLTNLSADGKDHVPVQFPATYQVGQDVLWPTFEGNVQDGTVIDRYGDPDLMLEFAEQYFKLYEAAMPAGRLPEGLVEVLTALHLLVTAAELGFKACLTRDGKDASGHSLEQLYEVLDPSPSRSNRCWPLQVISERQPDSARYQALNCAGDSEEV